MLEGKQRPLEKSISKSLSRTLPHCKIAPNKPKQNSAAQQKPGSAAPPWLRPATGGHCGAAREAAEALKYSWAATEYKRSVFHWGFLTYSDIGMSQSTGWQFRWLRPLTWSPAIVSLLLPSLFFPLARHFSCPRFPLFLTEPPQAKKEAL